MASKASFSIFDDEAQEVRPGISVPPESGAFDGSSSASDPQADATSGGADSGIAHGGFAPVDREMIPTNRTNNQNHTLTAPAHCCRGDDIPRNVVAASPSRVRCAKDPKQRRQLLF